MSEQEKWKWQEPGTTWKGVGLYHITLTIPDRQPLLGTLDIPDNNPTKANVRRTALGNALVDCLMSVPKHHPEVQVLHFCLMPDHLHAVLYVRRTMPSGIRALVRGFWQASKKLGRAWSAASSAVPNDIRGNWEEASLRGNSLREETARMEAFAASLRDEMGEEAYYRLAPVFTEIPFIRPMVHSTQLPNTIRYIDMNPQRLATKRLKPGFFRVQQGVAIGDRSYYGVGNTTLLMSERFAPVHVRSVMVRMAEHGDDGPLREGLPFVHLMANGFSEYYKPVDALFDACASGRLLMLSPWEYDAGKRHVSRAECVALNAMAEDICSQLNV